MRGRGKRGRRRRGVDGCEMEGWRKRVEWRCEVGE